MSRVLLKGNETGGESQHVEEGIWGLVFRWVGRLTDSFLYSGRI